MLGSIKEKLRRFMAGRYGVDSLNQLLNMTFLILMILSMVTRWGIFYYIGVAFFAVCWYRMLSRNISKRTEENYRYCMLKDRFFGWFRVRKNRWDTRKIYRYYRCPKCRQQLRVPRGRGKIEITCPKCSTRFVKKS